MDGLRNNPNVVWRESAIIWGTLALVLGMLGIIFYGGLKPMTHLWLTKEEYSHAIMIPFISLFLIWQKKDELERLPFTGSLAGLAVVFVGLGIFMLGQLGTSATIIQYAFLITLAGALLAWMGWRGFRLIAMPLFILLLMVPLPGFLYQTFSAKLQLLSSDIGVWIIRLFDISVYLEGNVIDLGSMKLQVVEACSGLRYLFPLMTLGFIAAYFFKAAFWKRAVIFLSTIPVTILMNSLRIGLIGVTVEFWGKEMAEGFLHDFEGWFVFMACTAVLACEMWLLARMGRDGRSLREVFGLEFPAPPPKNAEVRRRKLPLKFLAAVAVLVAAMLLIKTLPERIEINPSRKEFSEFPMELGAWKGRGERMEQIFVDELKFDDYLLADFVDQSRQSVNLYAAYYGSQRSDKIPHSPSACLPGGGWKVEGFAPRTIEGVTINGQPLSVNRTLIQHGEAKQLVYYWFQQRGRALDNEYLVKWFIFWDVITRNRSDGSLVRLVAPIHPGQTIEEVDRKLVSFTKDVIRILPAYIPD